MPFRGLSERVSTSEQAKFDPRPSEKPLLRSLPNVLFFGFVLIFDHLPFGAFNQAKRLPRAKRVHKTSERSEGIVAFAFGVHVHQLQNSPSD